jgi:hypothetical protein
MGLRIFIQCFYTMWNIGKMLNILFDTFHNTKYFHAHIYTIACHFCVGYANYPNAMKILW